jgi:hypothetical protein
VTGAPREHWFDRLAAPHTRRQGLRAALAAAALTLPLGRSAQALADNPQSGGDPHACQKGCFYTAHRIFAASSDSCLRNGLFGFYAGDTAAVFYGQVFGLVGAGVNLVGALGCLEGARLHQKARQYDCLQPDCPGFDPGGEHGPCFNCNSLSNTVCCPDPTSVFGYSCCSTNEPQPYCCAPQGGCKICGA